MNKSTNAIPNNDTLSYAPKYDGFAPNSPSVNEPLYAVHPQVVFAWLESDFFRTATRWRFDDS